MCYSSQIVKQTAVGQGQKLAFLPRLLFSFMVLCQTFSIMEMGFKKKIFAHVYKWLIIIIIIPL